MKTGHLVHDTGIIHTDQHNQSRRIVVQIPSGGQYGPRGDAQFVFHVFDGQNQFSLEVQRARLCVGEQASSPIYDSSILLIRHYARNLDLWPDILSKSTLSSWLESHDKLENMTYHEVVSTSTQMADALFYGLCSVMVSIIESKGYEATARSRGREFYGERQDNGYCWQHNDKNVQSIASMILSGKCVCGCEGL